jgi:hypothetical protein
VIALDNLYFYLSEDGAIGNERLAYHVKMLAISRVRDKGTGHERLRVELFDKNDDKDAYAVDYCSPLSLYDDIHKLRGYGFVAPRKEVMKMARIVEEKYHKLNCHIETGARTLENDIHDIIRFICAYIRDNNIEVRTISGFDMYCISVNDFRRLFKSSPYMRYRLTDIKRMLRDMECTVCSPNRYDYTIKTDGGGEPVKVIAISADAPDIADILQEINYENLCNELVDELVSELGEECAAI